MKNRKIRNFNRTTSHRKAIFNGMLQSFLENGHVNTTLPKAKELKRLAQIELAKLDGRSDDKVILVRIGNRKGDNAPMARVVSESYLQTKFPNAQQNSSQSAQKKAAAKKKEKVESKAESKTQAKSKSSKTKE